MPANMNDLTTGTILTKIYAGVTYQVTLLANGHYRLTGGEINEVVASLTAARRRITGETGGHPSGPGFFGLTAGRRNSTPTCAPMVKVKGKCTREGCYEPADCKHGFCGAHCHHGHELRPYASRTYPRNDKPHVGVEIEVKYQNQESFRRGLPLEGHRDGSLGTYGAEYKVLAEATKISDACAELMEEVWKRGARVDRACGLHVHLDARQLSENRRAELIAFLARTQDTWFSLVPPSRRNSTYVTRLGQGYDGGHTVWAHLTSYNTVEIRIHGGTLNHYKLAGWLSALTFLQAKANDATYQFPTNPLPQNGEPARTSAEMFWELFNDCPPPGKEYLKAREANNGVIQDRAFRSIEE